MSVRTISVALSTSGARFWHSQAGLLGRQQASGASRGGVNATGTEASSMIGSTLDQPGVSSVAEEPLMTAVSRQRYGVLAGLYDRHAIRRRSKVAGVVDEVAEADHLCYEFLSL